MLFSCAFDNATRVRSKRSFFLWSESFLKPLESQKKQLSCSSFGNNKKRLEFSLPLRYTAKNVKTKSTKCTFSLDSMKRNFISVTVLFSEVSSAATALSLLLESAFISN